MLRWAQRHWLPLAGLDDQHVTRCVLEAFTLRLDRPTHQPYRTDSHQHPQGALTHTLARWRILSRPKQNADDTGQLR